MLTDYAVDPAEFPDATEIRQSGNESIVLTTDFKVRWYFTCTRYIGSDLHLSRSMSTTTSPAS